MMRGALLRAERLGKRFGSVEAVKEASFCVHPNTITAFLGENGAGKTTVLRLVLGFLRPDSGRCLLAARRVGYVPERPAFFHWLRGEQILQCTARAFGLSWREANQQIESLSRRIAFDDSLLSRKAHSYSPGNQKKLSYLQCLLVHPDLWIIDEPFSALDPVSISKVRELMLSLKADGLTVFVCSHLLSELEKVCDDIIVIHKGRIIAQENLAKLRDSYIFVRFERHQKGRWTSLPLPCLQKTTDRFIECLLPRNRLGELGQSLLGTAEVRPPDLEALFFFLTD